MRSELRNRYISGLTMIELMLVVTIASILLAVSVPGFQDMISRMTVNSQVKTLRSALNYARSEAVRRNAPVSICSSTDGSACAADSWSQGWLVFEDDDGSGGINGSEQILRRYESAGGNSSVDYSRSNPLTYDNMGFSLDTGAVRQFVVCPANDDTDLAQAVEVSATGRARLEEEGLSC